MKAIFLFSIVVPISLLVTFRLTGVLREPPTISQSITVDIVSWNTSRPTKYVDLDEKVENSYIDDIISTNLTVSVVGYSENQLGFPSWGGDFVKLDIIATVDTSIGFIHLINIRFSRTDVYAFLNIVDDPDAIELENLAKKQLKDGTWSNEGQFIASPVNETNWCSLRIAVFWVLFDENDTNHLETIMLETTYFDGTAFRKINVPTQLEVLVP
jgi:hypothetical protein